jgi:hypothetical protein
VEHSDLLHFVVDVLERLGLRYFVTGSTVTIFHGEPRFTNDIDVVVELPLNAVSAFCREFSKRDFYVSEEAAATAIRRHSQFNIIHPASGLKVGVIVPALDEFNQARFDRATRVQAGADWSAVFSSPEDAILKKMQFFRDGASDKHLRDIAGVLTTSRDRIDVAYIDAWAGRLGLTEIWRAITGRVKLPEP